jgi:hypothetical protein
VPIIPEPVIPEPVIPEPVIPEPDIPDDEPRDDYRDEASGNGIDDKEDGNLHDADISNNSTDDGGDQTTSVVSTSVVSEVSTTTRRREKPTRPPISLKTQEADTNTGSLSGRSSSKILRSEYSLMFVLTLLTAILILRHR